MKYNGKEVTSDFLISIHSRIVQNTDKQYDPAFQDITDVLQAAEEVFAEMDESIKVGDRVTHKRKENWGEGVVNFLRDPVFEVEFDSGHYGEFRESSLLKIKEAQHGEG